jgi:hypothetical protein
MNLRRQIRLSALLVALAVPGSVAIAQEQDQQMPMMGQGTTGPGMMQGGMGPGMMHGQGGMGSGMMQGGMGPGMMGMCHGMMGQGDLKATVEGRLAYVKTALGITDDEAAAWKAYEDASRANVQSMQAAHQAMMTAKQSGSALDRMQSHITMMQARLDALKALQPATEALYKALTSDQQKKADALLGMGGGMM